MFFYKFMEQISKFICFCLFCHLPKLEASFLTFFLHELVHVAIHFYWQINTSFDFEGTVLRRQ